MMKFRILFIVLVLAMLACNLPSRVATNTPSVYELPTNTSPAATAGQTPAPLATNTPGAVPVTGPTPSVPTVFTNEFGVHCRVGPGTLWAAVSSVAEGDSSQIVGKNADGSWWYILDPFNEGQRCWVAASATTTGGNLSTLPVIEAPQASVSRVTVEVDPETLNPGSCAGAASTITINGTIETNGPTTVNWRLETEQGGPLTGQTTNFDSAGTKDFSAEYVPASPLTAGTYWVRLIVTSPNNRQAEATYLIECT